MEVPSFTCKSNPRKGFNCVFSNVSGSLGVRVVLTWKYPEALVETTWPFAGFIPHQSWPLMRGALGTNPKTLLASMGLSIQGSQCFWQKKPESPYLNLFGGQGSKDKLAKLISVKQDVTQGDLKRCLRFFMDLWSMSNTNSTRPWSSQLLHFPTGQWHPMGKVDRSLLLVFRFLKRFRDMFWIVGPSTGA